MNNIIPIITRIASLLATLHQKPLLKQIEQLSDSSRQKLFKQLSNIDPATLELQRNLIADLKLTVQRDLKPYQNVIGSGDLQRINLGKELVRQGKVGCLIVAGGQATRFGAEVPKGVVPISNVKEKSLFQIFFEKCRAAGVEAGRELPLAIMTSPLNHRQTQAFIEENNYFGLSKHQVDLFQQSMLPFLDEQGNMFLESIDTIAQGPDGNGSSLKSFVEAGLADKWRKSGVEIVIYILIDNPLADPFDADLAGTLAQTRSDAVIKCTDRRNSSEKVGVIVEVEGKPKVIEYFELPSEAATWGELYANISLFAFSLDFIEKASENEIPLHKAFKPTKALDSPAGVVTAWKFEKFIFDILDLAETVNVLHYPRVECFAPLKNKEGRDSPEEVKAALLARDREVYRRISGIEPPEHIIELSQQFYYPTSDLIDRWKNKKIGEMCYLE